jgi:hypothetical protein
MVAGIIVLILTGVIAFVMIDFYKQRYPFIDAGLLKRVFLFHVFLFIVYYLYVLFNRSDSKGYFNAALEAEDWFSLYGTSTTFIRFLAYPFVKALGFSYEAVMALFSLIGFFGFIYVYIFFKESTRFKHTFMGADLITIFMMLPNLHFWSSSLGKGSVIFLGVGLFFYGINRIPQRWLAILIGGVIIYHVRPHIMLIILVASGIGFVFSSRGVNTALKVVVILLSVLAFFYIYQDVLTLVGISEDALLTEGLDLTHRASELSKATSGVDISNYSLPMQLFTFLYRPLFFDAPGALGLFVSVENVFYLVISFKIFNLKGLRFILKSDFAVKSAIISFIGVSIALAQISGNLGLAIRQKSQVMILFLYVILMFLEHQKKAQYHAWMMKNLKAQKAQKDMAGKNA